MVHDKDCKEAVWVFDAGVGHLDEDVCVFLKVDHEFLLLLHVSELVLVHAVSVMEEQVVLTSQLDLDLVDLSLACGTVEQKNLNSDSLQCAYFLRTGTWVLNSELKWRLAIEHHHVTLS